MSKLLPLGSVIKDENEQKFMIVGYFPMSDKSMYKYSAVRYPFGLTGENGIILIDEDAVFSTISFGYCDKETVEFSDKAEEFIRKLAAEISANESNSK